MTEILDHFVAVGYSKQKEFVYGCAGIGELETAKTFASTGIKLIPRNEWKALAAKRAEEKTSAAWLVTRIYNQKQEGSCVANACSQALEITQARQFGRDKVVPLSAISLYKRIGSSPGSGAMCAHGVREMQQRGILPLDTPENRKLYGDAVMPNTGFYEKYPDNWEATAAHLCADEVIVARNLDEMISGLFANWAAVVGRQGHSICYVDPTFRGESLFVPYPNSWDYSWGQPYGYMRGGWGFDSESVARQSAGECLLIRSCVMGGKRP